MATKSPRQKTARIDQTKTPKTRKTDDARTIFVARTSELRAPTTEAPMILKPRRQPTPEEIAARAYELFLRRGGQHGQDVQDWLAAEADLLNGILL